jgi:hypothetical protein
MCNRKLDINNNYLPFGYRKLMFIFTVFIILIILNSSGIAFSQNGDIIDTDRDGVPDEFDTDDDSDDIEDTVEIELGYDPLNASDYPPLGPPDTDGDGIPDINDTDDDNDGLSDITEKSLNTNPKFTDTDGDLLLDYFEIKHGTDPLIKDTDKDGYTDREENIASTDPFNPSSFPLGLIADAGRDQIAYPNESVNFDGSYSIGEIANYSWDFDASDGIQPILFLDKPSHIYYQEGIYTVTLIISNGQNTDLDICKVIVDKDLATSMDIVRNRKKNPVMYKKDISLEVVHSTNESIIIEINGSLKSGAVVSFAIDSYTMILFENEKILIKFDDLEVNPSSLEEIVTSKGDLPLYNISMLYNSLHISIYIPSFSVHRISIEKVQEPSVTDEPVKDSSNWIKISVSIILIVVLIIISFILTYSYKITKDQKYYSSLKIDDERNVEFFNRIKNKHIDWEEYDSEK